VSAAASAAAPARRPEGATPPPSRRFWQIVLKLLVWLFMRVHLHHGERMPAQGGGIVYYNHIHWLDPPLIVATSPRYSVPLTKIEASRFPVVGLLLRLYHVIFISRGLVDREALRLTWELLHNGGISVISPEGTRSLDQKLMSAKDGLAFIARQAPEVWLIPCAVTGTTAFTFKFPGIFKRPHFHLTYGYPFKFLWPEGKVGRDEMKAMTDQAMTQLAALLPAEMRGDYATFNPDDHPWLEMLPQEPHHRG
jgi:1-acyl-sn-glycerol-3-phosphate acyltransferase